jgi:heterodisulfide reductase subunit B
MSDYIFYPGCSMESSAKAYYDSVMSVCQALDIQLNEINDWNCCGRRVPLHRADARLRLIAATWLWLRSKPMGRDSHRACSACYLNLAKADHYMHEDKAFGKNINELWLPAACTTWQTGRPPPAGCGAERCQPEAVKAKMVKP